jgi:ATP-dependent Lon protease
MKTIQNELGGNPVEKEIEEYLRKAETKKWNAEVKKVFDKELDKLRRLNPAAAEYSVQVITYRHSLIFHGMNIHLIILILIMHVRSSTPIISG